MATTRIDRRPTTTAPATPAAPIESGRKITPIKWFAGFGILVVAFQLYLYGRWLLPGPEPTPTGSDPVPGWMAVVVHAQEILTPLLLAVLVYLFIIRPWRRERRVPLYGLMIPALMSVFWQDLLANYFNHVFTYNAVVFNFGAWYSSIPGWASPHANRLAEPLFYTIPGYPAFMLPACLLLLKVIRVTKERRPRIGTPGLLLSAFLVGAPLVGLLETLWLRTGLYIYAGTIPAFTLFQDRYYQFPVYELFMAGALTVAWTAILYFRDDNGHTVAERGVDELRVTPRQKTALRGFALVGIVNIPFLFYNILMMGISLTPSFRWGDDAVNRSYFRDGVCGGGTTYHCPDKGIPIPRRGDLHVSPDGRLVP